MCNGQLMAISSNTALFSLLGTFYGGDGRTTFALPNLQGSAPLDAGQGPGRTARFVGETGGSQTVTLLPTQIPSHGHGALGATGGTQSDPTNHAWGVPHLGKAGVNAYHPPDANNIAPMSPQALTVAGGSQPHNNMPPYLSFVFIIALQGIFPPRN
jgi:microcystin-dependent protein